MNTYNPDNIPPLPNKDEPLNLHSRWLRWTYGSRVQKISIHLDVSCPHRVADEGCRFCNPDSFLPPSARRGDIPEPAAQFEAGISRFAGKYPGQQYIAYVQGYTGTLGTPGVLDSWYRSLLKHGACAGLTIGTRPDCLPESVIELLTILTTDFPGKPIRIELGAESFTPEVLEKANRRHSVEDIRRSIERLNKAGITSDLHLMVGLPGESLSGSHIRRTAAILNELPISMVKFHQFQLIAGSPWGKQYLADGNLNDYHVLTVSGYADIIIEMLTHLRPSLLIGRLAADADIGLLVDSQAAAEWQAWPNYRFSDHIIAVMQERGLYQGCEYAGVES